MSATNLIRFDESNKNFRRMASKETDKTDLMSPVRAEDSLSLQNSIVMTKRKSPPENRGDSGDHFIPLLKEAEETSQLAGCSLHPDNLARYYDISSPQCRLCSSCVLDLVINKNFNFTMTKEGIVRPEIRTREEEADRRVPY